MPEPLIYLDYNATTPIDPAVAEAMLPFLHKHFGNPSSTHPYGLTARKAIDAARRQVADLLGARPEEIVFTSGGSESNNTVIKGVTAAMRERGRHIIASAVEHPAVIEPCQALEAEGYQVTYLPVDAKGRVDPRDVARAITPQTILVTVMHANNEVGTVQPIAEIAALARRNGIAMHTDAAQSVGKIPVRVDELGVDFLSVAGHKLYAPKGVGALYIRSGRTLPKLVHGAGHESNRRAGTENVLEIVGLGKAAELAAERLEETGRHTRTLRDRLHAALEERLGPVRVNGDPEGGLPNTLSVCFAGVDASTLLAEVGDRVAASAGAACHAEGVDLSTVLQAMRVPVREAMGTVRFSVGRGTTERDVEEAATIVAKAVTGLQGAGEGPFATADDVGPVRLTRFTHGLGCACKLRPQELEAVLKSLPPISDPEVLVGTATADDAAVYRLSDDLALVQTVDFFTPICDDPRDFGAISAANSLSDIYAMGATPRFALSVVGFPSKRLGLSVLEEILAGAAEVASEAGIDIVGGHSVEDTEPKFGLAVTGTVHPDRVWTNAGAGTGDVLFLTKPIGTGILATAAKRDLASPERVAAAVTSMRQLNRRAAEVLRDTGGVTACTDVTGFGLLGHLRELAVASGVDVALDVDRVPVLDGVRDLAAADVVPGGSLDNLAHFSPHVTWAEGQSEVDKRVLADAQSSGGLLVAVSMDRADAVAARFGEQGVAVARVGEITDRGTGRIVCRRG
jgi:cysteine desulfurase NifS/selenium donor protein